MISTFTAFFDANVFYGSRLRSLVLYLAQTKIFRARWSEDVHGEWMQAVLRKRPDLMMERLEKTRRLMDKTVLDCLVTGYEGLISTLNLPDPDDRHVLAAAIVCRASCVVTFNERDFPHDVLEPFGLHTVHPDAFLLDAESMSPNDFADAVRDDFQHYSAPPLTFDSYVDSLAAAGVPDTAGYISKLRMIVDVA